MEDQKKKHSHGFTWGMIVGGAVVLMLTTKKGRDILKELAEGGIDGLDEYVDLEKLRVLTSEFDSDEPSVVDDEDIQTPVKSRKRAEKKQKRFFRKTK